MNVWLILWRRLLDLLGDEEPVIAITRADLDAINAMSAAPKEGWYAWECAQYRATGCAAFWFDPRRYDGTRFRYPDPTLEDEIANYEASLTEAMDAHGKKKVAAATWWVHNGGAEKAGVEEAHRESLDPIGWCVALYRSMNEPRVSAPPSNWLQRDPQPALCTKVSPGQLIMTTGGNNVALGYRACYSNTSGDSANVPSVSAQNPQSALTNSANQSWLYHQIAYQVYETA